MLDSGYLTVAKIGHSRIPVRIHWTAPVGAWLFTGGGLYPARWLTFLMLILFHELGHVVMVRIARGQVMSVDVNAIGGRCSWFGQVTQFQRSYIAFGGVLAQGVLFVAALLTRVAGVSPFGAQTDLARPVFQQ